MTVAGDAAGTKLDEVHIVSPLHDLTALMLTVSNRDASWKVALRANQPRLIAALHEFLLAHIGRGKHLVVGVSHWPSR